MGTTTPTHIQLHNCVYNTETDTLEGTHSAGFYSCINEFIKSLTKLLSLGIAPKSISFRDTLRRYKEEVGQDYFPLLFEINQEKKDKLLSDLNGAILQHHHCCTGLDPVELNFENMTKIMDAYFFPSSSVREKMKQLESLYALNFDKLIGVNHRGNDKWKEAKLLPIEDWLVEARKLLEGAEPGTKIFFCSDETSSTNRFLNEFGEDCFIIKEHPHADNKDYINLPLIDKANWCVTFDSVMRLISRCNILLTHSGNASYTCMLHRGTCKNVTRLNANGKFITYNV